MRRRWTILFFPCLLAACQAPPQPGGPTGVVMDIPDRELFIDQTLTLLREMDFTPRSVQRDRGAIVTQPTTSGQWFELWRSDSQGAYQAFESSIHTMRRILNIDIAPESEASENSSLYRLTVAADKQRYSGVERQITTSSGALALYSSEVPTVDGRIGPAAVRENWTSLGRDALLEQHVLDRIVRANPQARYVRELPPVEPVDETGQTADETP